MSIASRIQSIEEHIKESYQELEGIGIDTTEVDKNLENIPKLIDGYWETLPKVTGEGTSITLDNTKEGKMKIGLKGNTSQETTTGKNLANYSNWEQGNFYVEGAGINGNVESANVIRMNDFINVKPSTTYTLSCNTTIGQFGYVFKDTNGNITGAFQNTGTKYYTFTTPSNVNQIRLRIGNSSYPKTYGNNYQIQLEENNQATPYEEYTGGQPSPSPDYPQNIHVVSGNNTIKVEGKNLLKLDFTTEQTKVAGLDFAYTNSSFTLKGTTTGTYKIIRLAYVPSIKEGETYIFSRNVTGISSKMQITLNFYDSNNTNLGNTKLTPSNNEVTFTPNFSIEEVDHINFVIEALNNNTAYDCYVELQLEKGTEKTTWEEYKGASYPINLVDIELCKIGDYQDRIFKSSGKNLLHITSFDDGTTTKTNNGITATINSDSSITLNGTATAYVTFAIQGTSPYNTEVFTIPKGTYTLGMTNYSGDYAFGLFEWDISKTEKIGGFMTSSKTVTFSQPQRITYVRLQVPSNKSFTNYTIYPMLNEGTTALPYEPYGKDWYLNKQIGKVVLDGSENWNDQGNGCYATNVSDKYSRYGTDGLICNYFHLRTGTSTSNYFGIDNDTTRIRFWNVGQTLANFKTWLSNNNTIVYYALATPTYTQITDTTLINQLEALNGAKSYTTQTNISQENNDNASILNASALESM